MADRFSATLPGVGRVSLARCLTSMEAPLRSSQLIPIVLAVIVAASVCDRLEARAPVAQNVCAVTTPNEKPAPGIQLTTKGRHASPVAATNLDPNGIVTFKGGEGLLLQRKFLWSKVIGAMKIEGRRLDAPDRPLQVQVDHQFDSQDFQPSY